MDSAVCRYDTIYYGVSAVRADVSKGRGNTSKPLDTFWITTFHRPHLGDSLATATHFRFKIEPSLSNVLNCNPTFNNTTSIHNNRC